MSTPKVKKSLKNENVETNEINESERKRVESLKKKKETFRAKEQAIQNALKNFDNQPNKNKIIFDEDFDKIEEYTPKTKKKKKKDLFDNESDGDDNEVAWDNRDFEIKNNIAGKPFAEGVTLGNDQRFKLDKRFVEEDDNKSGENETLEHEGELDLQKEKEWQLDILGNVLGVPVAPKIKDLNVVNSAKKKMIRYDPMENDHKKYEIVPEKSEPVNKKVKKKKLREITEDTIESTPIEVSKEIYYSVSESLTDKFKEGGQFSLLKTLGKEKSPDKDDKNNNANNTEPVKEQQFRFNFDTKNPFKYDSSDEENDNEEAINGASTKTNNTLEQQHDLLSTTDRLFFDANDTRFSEATKFFSKESVAEGEFKNLRWELKQIMRSKIRKNLKKNQPWGGKRKVRKLS